MTNRISIGIVCFCIAITAATAEGSSARTFVSYSGVDTNPCTRTAPCRSFAAALIQTAPSGTILALDSAGFGTLTINQSVSVVAPEGIYAGIAAGSGLDGIQISGAAATDSVILRGLSIEGSGVGYEGVALSSDNLARLSIENCVVTGFAADAVDFRPVNNGALLVLSNVTLRDSFAGAYAAAGVGATLNVAADHVLATGNAIAGLWVDGADGTVTNSVVAGNLYGISAQLAGGLFTVNRCQLSGNGTALRTDASGNIYLANSVVSGNGTSLTGNVYSMIGDTTYAVKTNTFTNNLNANAFAGTFAAQ